MKNILFILMAAMCVGAGPSWAADKPLESKVTAYYFHGDFRCPTCRRLEQYSREAIETRFKDEIASGRLVFSVVNIDKAENAHFIDDYQLYAKSLVLSLQADGKEVRSKNLTGIWEHVGDKRKFFEYVTNEVKDFLKDVSWTDPGRRS